MDKVHKHNLFKLSLFSITVWLLATGIVFSRANYRAVGTYRKFLPVSCHKCVS